MSGMVGMFVAGFVGVAAFGIGFVWVLITAFRESTSQGVLCMFVPFYEVYYGITRWSSVKKPFVISLAGIIIAVVGTVPGIVGATSGIKPILAEFMEAGQAKNVEAAHACWSPRAVTEERISELIETEYHLFEGYKGLNLSSRSVQSSAGITRADVSGSVSYTDGRKLPLQASLVKENDAWKITRIQIGF